MQKFCTKCGTKLDDATGKCPICDRELTKKELRTKKREEKKAEKKAIKKEKWKKLSFKQKFKKICFRFVLIILVLLLLFGSGTATLVYFDIVDIPAVVKIFHFLGIEQYKNDKNDSLLRENDDKNEVNDINPDIQYKVEHPNAEEYYRNNSNVLKEINVLESSSVLSEIEVCQYLKDRGFSNRPITTSYSMNGEYFNAVEISNNSSEKHPIYEMNYITKNGQLWIISIINDSITAYPASYNVATDQKVHVILSEMDYVTSYDSEVNKFFQTIPYETELIVKKVEKIDANALEQLEFGEIDEL